jgi:hypothetical protein
LVWESLAQHSLHGSIRKLKGVRHCIAYTKSEKNKKRKKNKIKCTFWFKPWLLSFDRIPINFGVHKLWEKLKPHESILISLYTFLSMCCLNFISMSWLFWYLDYVMFILLNLLMMSEPWSVWKFFLVDNIVF